MKKRVLSLVLAFALVMSLLPSFSFAVDESEPSGVYVTYDFVGAYNATQGTDLTKYDYTHTNGFWSVDGIINGFVKESDVRGPTMHKSNGITVRYNGSVAAFKINVPKSGVYNAIKMKTSSFTNSTKALDVYILKGDTVLSADYDLSSFTPVADDVNLYAPFGADGITTASENINVTISKYLDAGEYYLVFKNVGTTNAGKADSYTRIHSLTLSGGSELAIMAESTPFVGSLKKYEARKIALKNLFMSDGSVINPSDITATYSSRDTGIATVSGAGLVTGVSEGETVIDITVAYNGKTKNIEHKVSVGNDSLEVSGVYVNYEFVAAYDATPGTDLTAYTYDHSNGFWSGEKIVNGYESSSSTYGPTMNSSYGLFLRYIGSRAAIKINVPKSGYYNSIRMYTNSVDASTSALDIYILDADKETLSDTLDMSGKTPDADNIDMAAQYYEEGKSTLGWMDVPISKYLDKGEHYLVFSVEGTRAYDNNKNSQARIYRLTLSGGNETAVMRFESTPFSEKLKIGEEQSIFVSGTMSDGNAMSFDDLTVTYESRNAEIASVTDYGMVTGVSEGDTVIDITVKKDGETVATTEHKVSVSAQTLALSPYTLKYDFAYDIVTTTPFLSITKDMTKYMWWPHSVEGKIATLRKMDYGLQVGTVPGQYIALTVNVPTAGVFEPVLEHGAAINGGQGEIYILPGDTKDVSAAIQNKANLYGSISYYAAAQTTGLTTKLRNVNFREAGEYIVVFLATAKGDGITGTSNYQLPCKLTFKGGDETAVTGVVPSFFETELEVGDTEDIRLTSYLSDCTQARVGDVSYEYESEDVSVATVDANGKITAISEGECDITVTARRGDSFATQKINVFVRKVGASSYTVVYDLKKGNTTDYRNTSYDNTKNFWRFAGTREGYATNADTFKASSDCVSFDIGKDSFAAFEINVPSRNAYNFSLSHKTTPSGGIADVYVLSAETEDIASALTDENKLGSVDYYSETAGTKTTGIGKYSFPLPGKYLVVFKISAASAGTAQYPSTLTLDGGIRYALMDVVLSFDGRIVSVVSGTMSDGSAADLTKAKIQYGIEDLTFGSVDMETGLFMPSKTSGKTNLYATVLLDGITAVGKTPVDATALTVPAGEITRKYVLNEYNDSWQNIYGNDVRDVRGITYEYTNDNWSWFGSGPSDVTASRTTLAWAFLGDSGSARLRIRLDKDEWFAAKIRIPAAGTYWASFEGAKNNEETHGKGDIYLIPLKENADAVTNALDISSFLGTVDFDDKTLSTWATLDRELGSVTISEPGEYLLVFKQPYYDGLKYLTPRSFTLDGRNILRSVNLNLEKSVYLTGETGSSSFVARLLDGTELTQKEVGIVYASDDETVAVFNDGIITAVGEGSCEVSLSILYKGEIITVKKNVTVHEAGVPEKVFVSADSWGYTGEKIKLTAMAEYKSGKSYPVGDRNVTYEITEGDGEIVDGRYLVTGTVGTVKLVAKATVNHIDYTSDEFEIVFREGTTKTEPTYYTNEKFEAVQSNIKKFGWAKEQYEKHLKSADPYLERVDVLYNAITGEGIPRSTRVGSVADLQYKFCRYCGVNIQEKYGTGASNAYSTNIYARPWKVQCPECKRVFPSNDFDKFYELGVDKKGYFDVARARQKHHNMLTHGSPDAACDCVAPTEEYSDEWYLFYGYGDTNGYLYNKLYPELYKQGGDLYNTDPRGSEITWGGGPDLGTMVDPQTGKTVIGGYRWGVDDGLGYLPGREYEAEGTERHSYIAFYNLYALTEVNAGLNQLARAYAYTRDPKYGRAGLIILDRIADVYPSFSYKQWDPMYLVTHGGTGFGKIYGKINDATMSKTMIQAADAFYPMIDDPQVISYLSEKAKEFGLENPKTSGAKIWGNIEDGLIRETFRSVKTGEIHGNFGMHQASVATAALVLDRQPESREMIEWIFAPGAWAASGNTAKNTGGNILVQLTDLVDRDGMGTEAAPAYNFVWISNMLECADVLEIYGRGTEYDLYENAKFAKMFMPYISVALVDTHHAQIGDSGWTANVEFEDIIAKIHRGFKSLKGTNLGNELAEYIYRRNGYTADGLTYDIFTANPESLETEVLAAIDDDVAPKSEMLPGYGFAILRDGAEYGASNVPTYTNNKRDLWMYFGRNQGHGHLDTLNIGMEAFGLNFAPDNGVPDAKTSKEVVRYQWVETTLAHNTVTVNGRMQTTSGFHGTPRHFDDAGMVKVMDVSAPQVYSAASEYRRTLVTVDAGPDTSYVVDFFRVAGGNDHIYSFHAQSDTISETTGLDNLEYQTDDGTENGEYVGSYAGKDVPYGPDPSNSTSENKFTHPAGFTWLKNVRRAKDVGDFSVDFAVTDFRGVLKDGNGLHLKMTMLNDFELSELALAGGYVIRTSENGSLPETLEYVLARRTGNNLDSLFTTVYEPYRNTSTLAEMCSIENITANGKESEDDVVKAVKVVRRADAGEAGRIDYIVYATNNDVIYTVTDGDVSFDFRGFVGVYSVNDKGENIYSYVNDGDIIGEETGLRKNYSGIVDAFTTEQEMENSIVLTVDEAVDTESLKGKYVYIENDMVQNAVYKIESASQSGNLLTLDIGGVTLIRNYRDSSDASKGFIYNIAKGQRASIIVSNTIDGAPEFVGVSDKSTSAGSVITITVQAESDDGNVVYAGAVLPRGASIDADTGKITWKPDSSQIGDNHFAITATDSSGRESTVHFIVTVYGSTTGGTQKPEAPSTPTEPEVPTTPTIPSTPGASSGGGGGGGGGGAAPSVPSEPSDKPNDDSKTDVGDDALIVPPSDEVETPSTTTKFVDLGNHAWAEDAINSLAADGIIKGTSEDEFSPANNITRADFAILLVRAFGLTSDNTENFADVNASDYFAPELAIARNTGLVSGIGDNKFAPKNSITRQDMMVIVYRVLTANPVGEDLRALPSTDEVLSQYPDFDSVAPYAQDAVAALIGAGLVNGKSGKIAPTDYTTRAEVAVLIKRILDYIK